MALIDLFSPASLPEVQAKVAQFAAAAKLILTSWYAGAPGEQLYQAFTRTMVHYIAGNGPIIRGMWLDYATDPGDPDPFDSENVNREPAPGFLSALGEQCFFTDRPGATFATTTIRFVNSSNVARTLAPGLVTVARAGHPEQTYVTTANSAFYTDPGGTRILAPGATLFVDVSATTAGTGYNASPGEITVLVNGWPGVDVANAGAATGTDRMDIEVYRALCRTQVAATSPNGAPEAFVRGATTNLDGSPLLRSVNVGGDGVTPVGIKEVYVTGSSTTGIVTVYYAAETGGAIGVDVDTANENIMLTAVSVPDAITFNGYAAINTDIAVTWSVEYRAKVGSVSVTYPTVEAAINAALAARFKMYPIGGFKRVLGAGTIPLEDIRATVKSAHPAIIEATLSSPVGATAIALGHKPRLVTPSGTGTAV